MALSVVPPRTLGAVRRHPAASWYQSQDRQHGGEGLRSKARLYGLYLDSNARPLVVERRALGTRLPRLDLLDHPGSPSRLGHLLLEGGPSVLVYMEA